MQVITIKDNLEYLRQLSMPADILNDDNLVNDIKTKEDKNYNEKRILINPKVITKEGLTEYREACVSCLDNCGRVL